MSWTCHEHAGAWSRSGSLPAAGQSSSVGPAGLPSSVASSTTASAAGPATGTGGVDNQSNNLDIPSRLRKPPSGHDADGETITAQLERSSGQAAAAERSSGQAAAAEPSAADKGDTKATASSVGKQGKGLGVFAKIKGRFGRHAG